MSRRLAVAGAAIAVVLALAGCAGDTGGEARPVTSEEAQLLALARFNNFDAGSRPFTAEITDAGLDLSLRGWVDYAAQIGYAAVTGQSDARVLLWTAGIAGFRVGEPDADGYPVLPIPSLELADWSTHEIDPAASRLDALIATLSALGADRPENPLLVQQSGALWLGTETIDGTEVTVFATPPSDEVVDASAEPISADTSPVRLWVDEGGLVLRLQLRLGGEWVTVDMPDQPGAALSLTESG